MAFTCCVPEGSLVLQRNWKRSYEEWNGFHELHCIKAASLVDLRDPAMKIPVR